MAKYFQQTTTTLESNVFIWPIYIDLTQNPLTVINWWSGDSSMHVWCMYTVILCDDSNVLNRFEVVLILISNIIVSQEPIA